MSGNSFGKIFIITTFGESHGEGIGVIVDGVPSNLAISEEEIQIALDERRTNKNIYTTKRAEPDKINILSGVFEGKTLGTPIALFIANSDQKSADYQHLKEVFRPNHADFTYQEKFRIRDYRGGGRASARETVARVAAGAIASKILLAKNIQLKGGVISIGGIRIPKEEINFEEVFNNDFFAPTQNTKFLATWHNLLQTVQAENDSLGAIIELQVKNMPVGLGEPVFDKLDAEIAKAIMSIPAVKAVEIGEGFALGNARGSAVKDEMRVQNNSVNFLNNHSGGILGGISNGDDLIVRFAVKPTSSIGISQQTIDKNMLNTKITVKGRHDSCVGIRAVPVGKAMLSLVIADSLLRDRARKTFNDKI